MSVETFCRKLPSLPFGKNDRKWFPSWIRRYAGSLDRSRKEALPVSESNVIRFLQTLRDNGVPAWQRLQAVRAVEAYRQHILNTGQPSLREVKLTLQRIDAQERIGGSGPAGDVLETSDVRGPLPANEPQSVHELRRELSRLDYKYDDLHSRDESPWSHGEEPRGHVK